MELELLAELPVIVGAFGSVDTTKSPLLGPAPATLIVVTAKLYFRPPTRPVMVVCVDVELEPSYARMFVGEPGRPVLRCTT